ncbi:MAG: single-stranded-DNA-specific exonuclease RecJ [Bacillota bacterium]|nr:single-stranded-DNA-specific exonuclease RecJ [Bacillota bacterium]
MKRWLLKQTKVNTAVMAQELGIRQATATVLANRGMHSRKEAREFLFGGEDAFGDPATMKDLLKGVSLIAEAIRQGKKITVYGDYDVDGVSSTTILYLTILRCGGKVSFYLPHRQKEGYGLNLRAVEDLSAEGTEVLFTCDNGISALQESAYAGEKGMTVVILDHHEPGFTGVGEERKDILPEADAIIDPKQKDCPYGFKHMCAGGLSYKFAGLLLQECGIQDERLEKQLVSFAAIATICDIVDLVGENRAIVKKGLEEIQKTENTGLRVLIEEAGLSQKTITDYHIGFVIGPCINAAGRLESSRLAVEMFCTEDETEARKRAKQLTEMNEERKRLTEEAALRADDALQAEGALQDKVLVLYDPMIHESIAGIVAGRIKDKYYHPTILITGGEDGAKGSGRSIEGYHIFEALFENRDLFSRFGGHAMAAGLSLPVENIPLLRQRLNAQCRLTEAEMIPLLRLDKALSFSEIDLSLAKEIKSLTPFGKGNPSPLFGSKGIHVDRLDLIGRGQNYLRLTLSEPKSGIRHSAISFDGYEQLKNMLKELYPEEECDKMIQSGNLPRLWDIVYSLDVNTYNGRSRVQLLIKDFRFAV